MLGFTRSKPSSTSNESFGNLAREMPPSSCCELRHTSGRKLLTCSESRLRGFAAVSGGRSKRSDVQLPISVTGKGVAMIPCLAIPNDRSDGARKATAAARNPDRNGTEMTNDSNVLPPKLNSRCLLKAQCAATEGDAKSA